MSLTLALLELRKFSFIRDLTRNTEIEKTTVWILFNICLLEYDTDTKVNMGVSLDLLLHVSKWYAHSFCTFELFSINQEGEMGKFTPFPSSTQIRVNIWCYVALRYWCRSGVFLVNFEQIFQVFLSFTLSK